MVVDFYAGGTLADAINTHRERWLAMAEGKRMKYAIDLMNAVAALHNNGVTHNDLTTSNIMFTDKSDTAELRIIDFGEARLRHKLVDGSRKSWRLKTRQKDIPELAYILFLMLCPCRGTPDREYIEVKEIWDHWDTWDRAKSFVDRFGEDVANATDKKDAVQIALRNLKIPEPFIGMITEMNPFKVPCPRGERDASVSLARERPDINQCVDENAFLQYNFTKLFEISKSEN